MYEMHEKSKLEIALQLDPLMMDKPKNSKEMRNNNEIKTVKCSDNFNRFFKSYLTPTNMIRSRHPSDLVDIPTPRKQRQIMVEKGFERYKEMTSARSDEMH